MKTVQLSVKILMFEKKQRSILRANQYTTAMSPKELTPDEEQRIHAVKTYIVNHLDEHHSIKQLSRKAALGEQRFKDGFYRLFEMHVGEYIHITRMQTAKFLLTHTDTSIREISLMVGYKQADNFYRAYKKFFGVTAHSMRK